MSAYGAYLRELREGEGRSLREMARFLEVSPAYISDVERGFRLPLTDEMTVSISRFLNLRPEKARQLLAYAAEGRVKNAISLNFPKLSEEAIEKMVKIALRDQVA